MSRYREQVASALHAVAIRGDTRYAWLGRGSRPLPASLRSALDLSERRTYLVDSLSEELYWSFYCHGFPVPARWGEPQPVSADPQLVSAISDANAGHGSWQAGWTVERVHGDEAIVVSPRLRARVPAAHCRTFDGALRPGVAVSVRLPAELPAQAPGFYTVVGEAGAHRPSSGGVVRAYWSIGRAGAPVLVRDLTSRLNAEHVPFRLKVADHPFRLTRCDAAVLYLPSDAFPALREALRDVAVRVRSHLRPRTPAFTLELEPGVGLAEHDGGPESFGTRRCALLADAIVRAHEQSLVSPGEQLAAVAARFAEDGVVIDAPYLDASLDGRHVL